LGGECVDEAGVGKVSFVVGGLKMLWGLASKRNEGARHCAPHDETVKRFGRDDGVFGRWDEKRQGNCKYKDPSLRSGWRLFKRETKRPGFFAGPLMKLVRVIRSSV
jgi:hypothetical protein